MVKSGWNNRCASRQTSAARKDEMKHEERGFHIVMKRNHIIAVFSIIVIAMPQTVYAFAEQTTFVQEPEAVTESTILYIPPPPPRMSPAMITAIRNAAKTSAPKVEKVTGDVYLGTGYALGNIIMVITSDGLVIIDTTESTDAAREIYQEFRKITDKPVKKIIYTHGHLDHIFGASVFAADKPDIISTEKTVEMIKLTQDWLKPYYYRSRKIQSGQGSPAFSRTMFGKRSNYRGISDKDPVVWPTITFDKFYSFTLGGKTFELFLTGGEAEGHLIAWLPKEKILFSGDLFYPSFPNLTTPMLCARSSLDWIHGLEKMISLDPEYIVPGHRSFLAGKAKINDILTNYLNAVRYVYDETLKAVNEGRTMDEAAAQITLPEKWAVLPYLQEGYGRVDWAVRGIYRELTGWYDGWGTGLNPLPPSHAAKEMVQLSGGADKILARAIDLQKKGKHQLACELTDIVIRANPHDKTAHLIKSFSLESMAFAAANLNTLGFYLSATAMEREKGGYKPQ